MKDELPTAFISFLFLQSEMQGQGWGSRLVQTFENVATKRFKFPQMMVGTSSLSSNVRAQTFYTRKCGFSFDEEIPAPDSLIYYFKRPRQQSISTCIII
jgi:ribosomal protein S18 acetylase RimI-like enzyme